jgi:hypothetical protein
VRLGAEIVCALSEQRIERFRAGARGATRPTFCGSENGGNFGGEKGFGAELVCALRAKELSAFRRRRARSARPTCLQALRTEGPGPVFGGLAEIAADGVHGDVTEFFLKFVGVA